MGNGEKRVAVLGDSRTLDTYYYNSCYDSFYGYHRTFHFLLRKMVLASMKGDFDVIHIPDHFRSHSVENNILRLALIDPAMLILCNGIWETLVNKEMFVEYVNERIKKHDTRSGETLELKYNSRILSELFVQNRLSNSPNRFLGRQQRVVSYFRRRRRQCLLMNLVVPNRTYQNRVHYAGNYRCIPEWDICLGAINEGLQSLAKAYGAILVDTHGLVIENGGFEKNLIDQWHFSESFHRVLAEFFLDLIRSNRDVTDQGIDHVSHQFMLHRGVDRTRILVYGTGNESRDWIRDHPKVIVEAVVEDQKTREYFQSIPVIGVDDVATTSSKIVLLAVPADERHCREIGLLERVPLEKILLYPEELQNSYYKSTKGML